MSATSRAPRGARRIGLRIFVVLCLLATAWFAGVFWLVSRQSYLDETRPADVIIVFGAAEYSGRPSPIYKARLDHAYTLFRQGMAPLIITTGGAAEDPNFSEGGVGRDYLISHGVPDNSIIAETQSSDTRESAARIANILRTNHLQTCLAVSDGYHLFRVKQMLEKQGMTVYASPRPDTRVLSRWQRIRVKLHEAMSYTVWKLGL
jgi:uncharacterized SAM-binding protein YcdF (DUF218 family)